MTTGVCATCQFWLCSTVADGPPSDSDPACAENECRRRAPSLDIGGAGHHRGGWLLTRWSQWCGEWEESPEWASRLLAFTEEEPDA